MTEVFFTDRELDIMSVLWATESGTVAEVREALDDDLGYTTVLKMLQILEEKGHIRHEEEGRAHRFYPRVAPEKAGRSAIQRILEKVFHGSAELLVAQLVSDRDLTPEALARMRGMIDERAASMEREGGESDRSGGEGKEDRP
jgi:predicted transcriptional regulator